jgi:hypothetical protein
MTRMQWPLNHRKEDGSSIYHATDCMISLP